MISSVRQRLTVFVASKKLSNRKFEQECGLYQGFINSLGQTIAHDKMELIMNRYPDLSLNWLLTGKGEMNTEAAPITGSEERIEYLKCIIAKYEQTIKEKDARIEKLTDILLDEKMKQKE